MAERECLICMVNYPDNVLMIHGRQCGDEYLNALRPLAHLQIDNPSDLRLIVEGIGAAEDTLTRISRLHTATSIDRFAFLAPYYPRQELERQITAFLLVIHQLLLQIQSKVDTYTSTDLNEIRTLYDIISPLSEHAAIRTMMLDLANKISYTAMRRLRFTRTYQNEYCFCGDQFSVDKDMVILKCNHYYHYECINRWFRTDDSCPLCKRTIVQLSRM